MKDESSRQRLQPSADKNPMSHRCFPKSLLILHGIFNIAQMMLTPSEALLSSFILPSGGESFQFPVSDAVRTHVFETIV